MVMAMSDEDLNAVSIELPVDDTREEVVVEKKPEAAPVVEKDDSALAELKAQIAAHAAETARLRAEKAEAERRAREEAERASRLDSERQEDQLSIITNALNAANREAESAERAFIDAVQSADPVAQAKAQRLIATVEFKIQQLENGRAALEERKKEQTKRALEPQAREQNPIDSWIEQLPAQSKRWMLAHRELADDPAILRKITSAANAAVDLENLKMESPEYFAYIEKRLGLTKEEAAEAEAKPAPKSRTVASAPVSNGRQMAARGGETMTLSPEMRQIAWEMYSDKTPEEAEKAYAIDRAYMIKTGRLAS